MILPPVVVQKLTKNYPRLSHPAVDEVSFTIERGQIFGLLGPNGAGKSTTIRMIAGMILPSAGRISVFGYDPARESRAVCRHIGLAGEGERSFYYRLTGQQNLEFFGGLAGLRGRHLRETVDEALEIMGLQEARRLQYMKFSTGMKRRLTLARAHLRRPPLYILDEPTSNVDPASAIEIRNLIADLARQGRTVLLATHNLPEAEQLCHQVAIMQKGQIVALDSPANLKTMFGSHPRRITITTAGHQSQRTTVPQSRGLEQFYQALATMNSIDGLGRQGEIVHFQIPAGAELTPIIKELAGLDLPVHHFQVDDSSLEDVFVRLTNDHQSIRKAPLE